MWSGSGGWPGGAWAAGGFDEGEGQWRRGRERLVSPHDPPPAPPSTVRFSHIDLHRPPPPLRSHVPLSGCNPAALGRGRCCTGYVHQTSELRLRSAHVSMCLFCVNVFRCVIRAVVCAVRADCLHAWGAGGALGEPPCAPGVRATGTMVARAKRRARGPRRADYSPPLFEVMCLCVGAFQRLLGAVALATAVWGRICAAQGCAGAVHVCPE